MNPQTVFNHVKKHLYEKYGFGPEHAKAVIATMRAVKGCRPFRAWWNQLVQPNARTEEDLAKVLLASEGIAAIYEAAFVIPQEKHTK